MIPCCVTPEQHAALKALSKRTRVSIQDYLRQAVTDMLAKHQPPAPDNGYITDKPRHVDAVSLGSHATTSYITEPPRAKRKGKPALTAEQIAAFDAVWYEPADISRFAERHAQVEAMRATGWRPPPKHGRLRNVYEAAAALEDRKRKRVESGDSRRRRLRELHPDKLGGRDQTPAERAEFTKLTKKRKRR